MKMLRGLQLRAVCCCAWYFSIVGPCTNTHKLMLMSNVYLFFAYFSGLLPVAVASTRTSVCT